MNVHEAQFNYALGYSDALDDISFRIKKMTKVEFDIEDCITLINDILVLKFEAEQELERVSPDTEVVESVEVQTFTMEEIAKHLQGGR